MLVCLFFLSQVFEQYQNIIFKTDINWVRYRWRVINCELQYNFYADIIEIIIHNISDKMISWQIMIKCNGKYQVWKWLLSAYKFFLKADMGIKKIPRLFKLCFIWTFDIAMCFITNLEMDSLKRIGEQTCFFSNNDRLLQICFEHLTLRYVLSQIWIMEILKRIGEDTCPFQMMIGCYLDIWHSDVFYYKFG